MQVHGFLDPGWPFIFIVITGGYIVTVFRSDRCKDWTPWSTFWCSYGETGH